jgi:hypothetical protein
MNQRLDDLFKFQFNWSRILCGNSCGYFVSNSECLLLGSSEKIAILLEHLNARY